MDAPVLILNELINLQCYYVFLLEDWTLMNSIPLHSELLLPRVRQDSLLAQGLFHTGSHQEESSRLMWAFPMIKCSGKVESRGSKDSSVVQAPAVGLRSDVQIPRIYNNAGCMWGPAVFRGWRQGIIKAGRIAKAALSVISGLNWMTPLDEIENDWGRILTADADLQRMSTPIHANT